MWVSAAIRGNSAAPAIPGNHRLRTAGIAGAAELPRIAAETHIRDTNIVSAVIWEGYGELRHTCGNFWEVLKGLLRYLRYLWCHSCGSCDATSAEPVTPPVQSAAPLLRYLRHHLRCLQCHFCRDCAATSAVSAAPLLTTFEEGLRIPWPRTTSCGHLSMKNYTV